MSKSPVMVLLLNSESHFPLEEVSKEIALHCPSLWISATMTKTTQPNRNSSVSWFLFNNIIPHMGLILKFASTTFCFNFIFFCFSLF